MARMSFSAPSCDGSRRSRSFPPILVTRVLISATARSWPAFFPLFDEMSSANGLKVSSFNSGFPASTSFAAAQGDVPARPGSQCAFAYAALGRRPAPAKYPSFIPDHHAVIDELFPFRNGLRDFTDFVLTAPSHGGQGVLPGGEKMSKR